MANNNNTGSDDGPLPLAELRDFVSEETYEWLEDADQKERAWQKIQKSLQGFQQQAATTNAPEVEEIPSNSTPLNVSRVLEWTSSLKIPDGYGGFEIPADINVTDDQLETSAVVAVKEDDNNAITVQYVMSDNWQGFGNQVWAASRHFANMIADETRCRVLLAPLLSSLHSQNSLSPEEARHPLFGMTFCELGTGAGIPSWTAMRCGARVMSLDQAIPGRIRVTAECAARNWRDMTNNNLLRGSKSKKSSLEESYEGSRPMVCPHDWGNPVDDVLAMLATGGPDEEGPQKRFDVVVATDCCFMSWFHSELLDSIDMLLSDRGVAILTFSLHGNEPDEQTWSILDLAQEKGFATEQPMLPEQLTPQLREMKTKQALVYTLRLTRRSK